MGKTREFEISTSQINGELQHVKTVRVLNEVDEIAIFVVNPKNGKRGRFIGKMSCHKLLEEEEMEEYEVSEAEETLKMEA